MKKKLSKLTALLIVFLLVAGLLTSVTASEVPEDDAVADVIAQLEAIDTLQQMQDNRNKYTVGGTKNYYDGASSTESKAKQHLTQRNAYDEYVSTMLAQRAATQQAYDSLTDAQKAQIDDTLVAKLSNELDTVFHKKTVALTPSDDAYTYEYTGFSYEVSHHMAKSNLGQKQHITQNFIVVDTSGGETSWTSGEEYVYGESNFDVVYCCDVVTGTEDGKHYKRINLEDSGYYGKNAAKHIRAIMQNAYPYVSLEQAKANLISQGMKKTFVDSLTRADFISATQIAVWSYANNAGGDSPIAYLASIDQTRNDENYFSLIHDYENESFDWFPEATNRSYDAKAESRVNTLAHYLCNLEGVEANEDQIVISDVEVTRAELIPGESDEYLVGMYINVNHGCDTDDNITVKVTSSHDNGTVNSYTTKALTAGETKVQAQVRAVAGDEIKVVVEGTQNLEKGVYFYEPEGGRDAAQCFVGVAEGETKVGATETFGFDAVGEYGLCIYKTATGTDSPISDIEFRVYNVAEDTTINEKPTAKEIEKYTLEANLAATITTDSTGYAYAELGEGTYLVVEEHNKEKVESPVEPFYVQIPMTLEMTSEDDSTTVVTQKLVSVYPKNKPVTPEEPPVIPPTPSDIKGQFSILKYDADDKSNVLEGAGFRVYRAATAEDTDTAMLDIDGIKYAAVELDFRLTTDANGIATSPELECGVYFIEEITAPEGYQLSTEIYMVTVVPDIYEQETVIEVPNEHGVLLPETGGMGTAVFTLTGITLMLLAGTVILMRKRTDAQ